MHYSFNPWCVRSEKPTKDSLLIGARSVRGRLHRLSLNRTLANVGTTWLNETRLPYPITAKRTPVLAGSSSWEFSTGLRPTSGDPWHLADCSASVSCVYVVANRFTVGFSALVSQRTA